MPIVQKFWSLNLQEPQGPVQACSGKVLPLQSAVWDNRRKVLPTVQRNLSDVHNFVEGVEHVTTHRGENFVLQNDRENHVVILGCESAGCSRYHLNGWHFRLLP